MDWGELGGDEVFAAWGFLREDSVRRRERERYSKGVRRVVVGRCAGRGKSFEGVIVPLNSGTQNVHVVVENKAARGEQRSGTCCRETREEARRTPRLGATKGVCLHYDQDHQTAYILCVFPMTPLFLEFTFRVRTIAEQKSTFWLALPFWHHV